MEYSATRTLQVKITETVHVKRRENEPEHAHAPYTFPYLICHEPLQSLGNREKKDGEEKRSVKYPGTPNIRAVEGRKENKQKGPKLPSTHDHISADSGKGQDKL